MELFNSSLSVTPFLDWAHWRTNSRWQCASQVAWTSKSKVSWIQKFVPKPTDGHDFRIFMNHPCKLVRLDISLSNLHGVSQIAQWAPQVDHVSSLIGCCWEKSCHPITRAVRAWSYEERACRLLLAYGLREPFKVGSARRLCRRWPKSVLQGKNLHTKCAFFPIAWLDIGHTYRNDPWLR